jgi:hypothetical protein
MRTFPEAHKTDEFIELFDQHFTPFKDKPVRLLEIGVQHGGSIQMWREFFTDAKIVGVDVLEDCKKFATNNVEIRIGDQASVPFLESLGEFDIIIDDGGHTMMQQQISFRELFPKLSDGGVYVIEDLHTSYWKQFLDSDLTTIDYLKGFLDDINWEATTSARCETGVEHRNPLEIGSMHVYPSIVFIYKKKRT